MLRLTAWLPRRKIAKPRRLQHQYKSRSGSGRILARPAFAPRFLLLGDDDELSFFPKPRRRNPDCSAKAGFPLPPEEGVDAVNHRIVRAALKDVQRAGNQLKPVENLNSSDVELNAVATISAALSSCHLRIRSKAVGD
jgi:hypothetical protein